MFLRGCHWCPYCADLVMRLNDLDLEQPSWCSEEIMAPKRTQSYYNVDSVGLCRGTYLRHAEVGVGASHRQEILKREEKVETGVDGSQLVQFGRLRGIALACRDRHSPHVPLGAGGHGENRWHKKQSSTCFWLFVLKNYFTSVTT